MGQRVTASIPLHRLRGLQPAGVALLAAAVSVAWSGAYLLTGHNVLDFARIGTRFIAQGDHRSSQIYLNPGYRPPANPQPGAGGLGYDGQMYYYIAVDPTKARYYLDDPSYRYDRILYPIAARVLAGTVRDAVAWTLLLINLLAVGGGTWALARWLAHRHAPPAWALIYGLWPGMLISVQRDLSEPLAYGLVAAGLLALDLRGRWRLPTAALAFALAGLTRQTTLLFPVLYALWLAAGGLVGTSETAPMSWRQRRRDAFILLVGSCLPYAAWWAFVWSWLGRTSAGHLNLVPFIGFFQGPFSLSHLGVDIVFVAVPVFAWLLTLTPRSWVQLEEWHLGWALLVGGTLLNIVFLGKFSSGSFPGKSRQALEMVIAALMCVPFTQRLTFGRQRTAVAFTLLAMVMLPVVIVYGFVNTTV